MTVSLGLYVKCIIGGNRQKQKIKKGLYKIEI